MKTIKNFGLVLALLLMGNLGFSQGFDPSVVVQRQMAELTEKLALDKKQEKKLYYILMDSMEEMSALRGNGKSMEENRETIQEIFQKQSEEFKKELSQEQFEKYEAIQAERRERMSQNGGNGGGWQRPN